MSRPGKSGEDHKVSAATRAVAARHKAGQACVKKLEAAKAALNEYLRTCRECADGSGDEQRGIADGRQKLIRDIDEYSAWLHQMHN
jgi:hypothetical protein